MRGLIAAVAVLFATEAFAQDIPGIEICTAERDMVRRTSCLQSNVNFLQATIAKESAAAKRNLDAANRQIDDLKRTVGDLQKTIGDLQKVIAELQKPKPEKAESEKVPR